MGSNNEVRVYHDHTGYLVSLDLLNVSTHAYPVLIDRAWQVTKLIQDLLPGALMTAGYGSEHCGLRIIVGDTAVRQVTGSKAEDMRDDLEDWLRKRGDKLHAIAKFVEDKLNE